VLAKAALAKAAAKVVAKVVAKVAKVAVTAKNANLIVKVAQDVIKV